MIKVSLHFLSTLLNAEYIGSENVDITEVTIDTRKVTAGCLFVALKGERFDGHDFAEDAVAAGAGALLVSKRLLVGAPQLVVKDTRAMCRLCPVFRINIMQGIIDGSRCFTKAGRN